MESHAKALGDIKVSVIIATMASSNRARLLVRAVESIRASSTTTVAIIVVVNGRENDAAVCNWLIAQPDVRYEYMEEPSLPKAILRGRSLVATEFFATLDDDDEYLPLAIDIRMHAMNADAATDIVVTNGYRMTENVDTVCYQDLVNVSGHPLQTLMVLPWLSSCNALYRTASVGSEYFENSHPYGEWTWLAFKLAIKRKKIISLDALTFRIHDTAVSLSKTLAYASAQRELLERMLGLSPPPDVVKLIGKKMGAIYHQFSNSSLKMGNRAQALQWHLRSLIKPGGFRYLSYSRHFFMRTRSD